MEADVDDYWGICVDIHCVDFSCRTRMEMTRTREYRPISENYLRDQKREEIKATRLVLVRIESSQIIRPCAVDSSHTKYHDRKQNYLYEKSYSFLVLVWVEERNCKDRKPPKKFGNKNKA